MSDPKEYIDRGLYCETICRCNESECDKSKCPIWNAPAADVAPVVHGEWVYDHWCEFKCSNCGTWSNSKPYKGKENFCPNCGAKMDGGRP